MDNQVINLIIHRKTILPVSFDICFPKSTGKAPLIIFCHGFKGFKDWGSFNYISNCFATKGMAFLKFNFSHNGTTPDQPLDFADLNAFGCNTFSKELDDLECIINWVESDFEKTTGFGFSSINLMGHSRGGGIAILKVALDKRISKLITWAAVASFEKMLQAHDKEQWEKDGVVHIMNSRTKQNMPLRYTLYKDLQENKEELNILKAAQNISVPWLIVHAKDDNVVLLAEAKKLNQINKQSKLEIVPGGAHTFGASHPFNEKDISEHLQNAISKSISFIKLGSRDG